MSQEHHFEKDVLTHEVFKHGLLMSQQVVNNGFPSMNKCIKETTRQITVFRKDNIYFRLPFQIQ